MARARIVELILTEDRRGMGTEDDPLRTVLQLWTKGGIRVAEDDPIGSIEGRTTYVYLGAIAEEEQKRPPS